MWRKAGPKPEGGGSAVGPRRPGNGKARTSRPGFLLEPLEPRILLSADPLSEAALKVRQHDAALLVAGASVLVDQVKLDLEVPDRSAAEERSVSPDEPASRTSGPSPDGSGAPPGWSDWEILEGPAALREGSGAGHPPAIIPAADPIAPAIGSGFLHWSGSVGCRLDRTPRGRNEPRLLDGAGGSLESGSGTFRSRIGRIRLAPDDLHPRGGADAGGGRGCERDQAGGLEHDRGRSKGRAGRFPGPRPSARREPDSDGV